MELLTKVDPTHTYMWATYSIAYCFHICVASLSWYELSCACAVVELMYVLQQGWSSAYSLESLIMQIAATLVKGKARIKTGKGSPQYSLQHAQQSFKGIPLELIYQMQTDVVSHIPVTMVYNDCVPYLNI